MFYNSACSAKNDRAAHAVLFDEVCYRLLSSHKREGVEKQTTPQESPIHLAELRLMAHVGPLLLDGLDLLDGNVQRIDLGEQKQWRSLQANGNLAPSICPRMSIACVASPPV